MKKTILIVDDSASIRQVVSMTLKEAGFEVLEAFNGKEGLNKLNGSKSHLIISDVNMPIMGGIEMVKSIKQLPYYKFTPIIMLTTEASEEMKQQGKAVGAKAWMVKPFKPEQLLHAVQILT